MKKLLMIAGTVLLALSLCAISVAADMSWVTDAESFRPVGDAAIDWDAEAGEKLNLSDGRMDDWLTAGYTPIQITPDHLASWIGSFDSMPENFGIRACFVADAEYLYIGLDVTDPVTVFGKNTEAYISDGDSIQMMVDFGGRMKDLQANHPDEHQARLEYSAIFYSFDANGDGEPLQLMRQNSDNDGWLSEDNGDPIKGATGMTENGWFIEMALSWQMLYEDIALCHSSFEEDPFFYIGGKENKRLRCNLALYYLNMDEPDGTITWAAGTTDGRANEYGNPDIRWDPIESGIHLYMEYEKGMTFKCDGILVLGDYSDPSTEPATEPVTEGPIEETIEYGTEVATEIWTEIWTEVATVAPEEMIPESAVSDEETEVTYFYEMGCEMTIGMGTVTLLAVAAAVVLKKKDD